MKKKMLDVVFILDKSGSMRGSEKNTIDSFNEYLEREKKNNFQTKITTVLFSDQYQYLYKRKDVKEVPNITFEDYFVGGCTALYDSLGNAIHYAESFSSDKVLFVIVTDGEENASSEFSKGAIKKLIRKHSDWEFIYIGADIDSYAVGSEIGIRRNNIANYKKDKKGTSLVFQSLGRLEKSIMCDEEVGSCWKEELENYLSENQTN